MIRFTTGDVIADDAEALVNTVNCVGVMGRGVALQFKRTFPAMFKAYAAACKRGEVVPGRMFVYETGEIHPRWIINFPTKRHWKGKSRMEDIDSGLVALTEEIRDRGIRSIALPPLGSGLGGLWWPDVRERIEGALGDIPDLDVTVYEPSAAQSDERPNRSTKVPRMTAGRAALVGLMRRYLEAMMDVSVSLLEAHKLMYFLQVAGEPLKLRYVEAPYGPYALNLRHVFLDIEGHLISGYKEGDAPATELTVLPGAYEDAEAFLESSDEAQERFARVANLVHGFESPFGLELLATTHWVAARDGADSDDAIVEGVYRWAGGKRQFSPEQIRIAADRLREQGWLGRQLQLANGS